MIKGTQTNTDLESDTKMYELLNRKDDNICILLHNHPTDSVMVLPIIGGLHIEVKILTHWMEKAEIPLIKVFRFLTFTLICSPQINPECICLCDLAKNVYIICIIGKAYTIRFLVPNRCHATNIL